MYKSKQQNPRQRAHSTNTNPPQLLNFVQVIHNPSMKQIDSAVIWLHGLGADGNDFAPIVPELRLPVGLSTRFIFPHAPVIPVTVNGGYAMPAWYDILELSVERKFNETQLQESVQAVYAFVDALMADGISSERIIIAGFSQGGAVAYEAALASPFQLAGLLTLSTYFATKDSISYSKETSDMPVFIGHGTKDDVVPEVLGTQAKDELISKGYHVNYNTYDCAHGVFGQEILDVGDWITECLTK